MGLPMDEQDHCGVSLLDGASLEHRLMAYRAPMRRIAIAPSPPKSQVPTAPTPFSVPCFSYEVDLSYRVRLLHATVSHPKTMAARSV